jgi:MFS family permease
MLSAEPSAIAGRNDPRAVRMGVIAFINQNITIGCLWGSFSVLAIAVEKHLAVSREMSMMAVPALNLATAFCAPLAGGLANKLGLRQMMLVGSALSVAGFALLAVSHQYALYILAYGLLLGPGMATVGVVLPPTLVTRWFAFNRGRALGITTTPLVITAMPLLVTWMLQSTGLVSTYWMLAALSAICVAANVFVIDRPPDLAAPPATSDNSHGSAQIASQSVISVTTLLRSPAFWTVALAAIAPITGAVVLTASMVPLAEAWGLSPAQGATLLSLQSLMGITGTVIFGWIADRLGGVLTLALIAFDGAVLWALLMLHPSFPVLAAIIGVIGMHGAGSLPVSSAALSELFGRESFSRAYGIFNLINLPFAVLCVPTVTVIYGRTGSYTNAILAQVIFFAVAVPLALFARSAVPRVREAA